MNTTRCRQRGAVILTVCFMLLFLLGFMGIALDLGRMFIVKTELQTAMDSCALSAAQELDAAADSTTRALSAGLTAANVNRVNLQSSSWDGQGQLTAAGIRFRDASYNVTTNPTTAKYAECEHIQPGIRMWLLHAMQAFDDTVPSPATRSVTSRAVATRSSAQSSCPVPLALKPKLCGGVQCPAPNYGFTTGDWVRLIMAPGAAVGGQIGWANLDGSSSASETTAEMEGYCGTEIGDTLGTPGVQASVVDAWNYRFGIYKNTVSPAVKRPDFSGYGYTSVNWPAQFNAYNGTPGAGAPVGADNFVAKRLAFASCADTTASLSVCETTLYGSPPTQRLNSFQKLANPGVTATDGHRAYGQSRRMVLVPVINGAANVIDFACMFMLQPLTIPMSDVYMEYRGNAGVTGSPCTTSGLPGGAAGPLVPVLVR